MSDIQALLLLSQEAENLRTIKTPPDKYSETAKYRENTLQIIDGTVVVVKNVKKYVKEILELLEVVSNLLTDELQEKIKHPMDSLVLADSYANRKPSGKLKQIYELVKMAREIRDKKLDELIDETKFIIMKIEITGDMTESDLNKVKGSFVCWVNKEKITIDAKERLEDGRKRERVKKEELEIKDKKEKRKKAEEQKGRQEEEKDRKKSEEEKKREEEEEDRRECEEEKTLQEEEEEDRSKHEAEAQEAERNRKQSEEERSRAERLKEENERQEKEKKRQRGEAERKRKEEEQRKRREEDERRRRFDPENWTPNVYNRSNTESNEYIDQVDGNKNYHKGICCVITAPDGTLNKDDVQCLASDEVDDVIETLYDGERLASSVIRIDSNKGNMDFEVPIRVHVPHATSPDSEDEVVFKYSVTGSDEWLTKYPAMPTKKSVTTEKVELSCLDLASLESVKMAVVVRPRGETITVDRPGVNQYLKDDRNVKLFIPRDTYSKQTEILVTTKTVPLEIFPSVSGKDGELVKEILSTSSLITINCQKPTGKAIEVDLSRTFDDKGSKNSKGKRFHLFRGKENVWKVAKAEYKRKQKAASVHLPSSHSMYNVIEIVMSEHSTPKMAIEAATHMYDLAIKTVVSVLVKQKTVEPTGAVFQCVRWDQINSVTSELSDLGYDYGGGISRMFCIQDGDLLHIRSQGNVQIDNSSETKGIMVPFSSLIDKTRWRLRLTVVDRFKQKDMPYYNGSLLCTIIPRGQRMKPTERSSGTLKVEIQLQIPKEERPRAQLLFIPVRFSYTLSILSKFLSAKLTNQNEVLWMTVLSELDNSKIMTRIERRARIKCDPANERDLCETFIKDWMKSQPKNSDKAIPVLHALRSCGLSELAVECETLLDFFTEFLSDKVLRELCQKLSANPSDVGQQLGLTSSQVDECVKTGSNGNEDPNFLLLQEWRESDTAINEGANALNYLKRALEITN